MDIMHKKVVISSRWLNSWHGEDKKIPLNYQPNRNGLHFYRLRGKNTTPPCGGLMIKVNLNKRKVKLKILAALILSI
jgi:hypothetical protein